MKYEEEEKEEVLVHTFEACAGFQWGAVLYHLRPARDHVEARVSLEV